MVFGARAGRDKAQPALFWGQTAILGRLGPLAGRLESGLHKFCLESGGRCLWGAFMRWIKNPWFCCRYVDLGVGGDTFAIYDETSSVN